MQQQQLVDPADPHEPVERLVERVLGRLLADQAPAAGVELAVEHPEPGDLAARDPDIATAVEIKAIAEVLRRVARVHVRLHAQQLEPLLEAEHPPGALELLGDRGRQRLDLRLGAHWLVHRCLHPRRGSDPEGSKRGAPW